MLEERKMSTVGKELMFYLRLSYFKKHPEQMGSCHPQDQELYRKAIEEDWKPSGKVQTLLDYTKG